MRRGASIVLIALSLLLFACSNDNGDESEESEGSEGAATTAEGEPTTGGTLRFGLASETSGYNPTVDQIKESDLDLVEGQDGDQTLGGPARGRQPFSQSPADVALGFADQLQEDGAHQRLDRRVDGAAPFVSAGAQVDEREHQLFAICRRPALGEQQYIVGRRGCGHAANLGVSCEERLKRGRHFH